ncbi:hypothetical protein H0H92_004956 [Tricholoma furcatifolium]|nr:hypothetical protein H0H92_004956 [Tricholoma furcatifolium]
MAPPIASINVKEIGIDPNPQLEHILLTPPTLGRRVSREVDPQRLGRRVSREVDPPRLGHFPRTTVHDERAKPLNAIQERSKNHTGLPRPTSSLGFTPPHPKERTRTRSLIQSDVSYISPARSLHRQHSFTDSSRASSPAGSTSSHQEEQEEIVHERERNWNAPRPKWTHSSPRPASPSKIHSPRIVNVLERRRADSPLQRQQINDRSWTGHDTNHSNDEVHTNPRSSPLSFRQSSQPRVSRPKTPTLSPPPSPSTPSTKAKGKAKADPGSVSRSSVNSGMQPRPKSSFLAVKDRSSLSGMAPEQQVLPSSSRKSIGKNLGSSKPSGIPVRSPKKHKPKAQEDIDPISFNLVNESALSQTPPEVLASAQTRSETSDMEESIASADEVSEPRTPPQELTPTISARSISFSPQTQQRAESRSYTPPDSPDRPTGREDVGMQSDATQEQIINASDQSLPASPGLSPPASPLSASRDLHEPASYLSTPPRRPSFNTSKLEFQTPSPPKNMPDLPGPPTSSEDTDDEPVRTPKHSDTTALKTPRPPGAWSYTPAPTRTTTQKLTLENDETEQEMPPRKINLTATKTPKPPGAWAETPAPPSREVPSKVSQNVRDDHESTVQAVPASFSKTYTQTPAPPGAWMATPRPRKNISKVRFNPVDDGATTDSSRNPFDDVTNTSSGTGLDAPLQTSTPPASVPSRRNATPKSPGIRVLDAFGREIIKDEASIHNSKGGIRVLDAMGREAESNFSPEISTSEPSIPLKHDEALTRVRQGLADLVHEMDEMDMLEKDRKFDYARLQELQHASSVARASRAQVRSALSSNTADITRKLEPLRDGMKKSKLLVIRLLFEARIE